jgi:HEAT repeat protein
MSMLEEDLAVLVERGDLEVAADAVSALIEALGNDRLKPDQRSRLDDSVNQFTGSRAVGQIVRALQLYRPGTSDYEAAARLLEILDDRTLEALLQLLAEASDMTARKYLIELLSGMAESHIAELAARLGDPRWYFVRNIVTILAATRQPTTLRYFERTIRHPEPRVRRETIRALSVVPDRRATEMLIAALSDDDEQSVQLAARYLGLSGVAGAVSRLEQVAKGQGHGNRDLGPRVEAIEALGRIGAVESMPALKALASRRGLIRGTRGREVRAAAAAALERVRGGADA